MTRFRPVAVAAPLIGLLVLTGCAPAAPADPAPTVPSTPVTSPPAPASEVPATAGPSSTPSEAQASTPTDWVAFALGDGRTSWSQPEGWTADITRQVAGADGARADYRGVIRDGEGTPMLRFTAVAEGQYTSDGVPCERPETEVFEVTRLGAVEDAALVAVAFQQGDGVVLAAGISQNDAREACEPGILAVYPEGYDWLAFEIIDDAGEAPPTFDSFDAARAYTSSDEYREIRQVLASFALVARS